MYIAQRMSTADRTHSRSMRGPGPAGLLLAIAAAVNAGTALLATGISECALALFSRRNASAGRVVLAGVQPTAGCGRSTRNSDASPADFACDLCDSAERRATGDAPPSFHLVSLVAQLPLPVSWLQTDTSAALDATL